MPTLIFYDFTVIFVYLNFFGYVKEVFTITVINWVQKDLFTKSNLYVSVIFLWFEEKNCILKTNQ